MYLNRYPHPLPAMREDCESAFRRDRGQLKLFTLILESKRLWAGTTVILGTTFLFTSVQTLIFFSAYEGDTRRSD